MRELEGLVPVLQRCQLDARNPQIREWAILAVRYLTEDESNREFIAAIERAPREVFNAPLLSPHLTYLNSLLTSPQLSSNETQIFYK